MKRLVFDAVGQDGKPHRLSLNSVSIASVEENAESEEGKICVLRGRNGETYLVKGDFEEVSDRLNPKKTRWSKVKDFLNTNLGIFVLTAIFVTFGGALVKWAIENYTEREQKLAHERSLLIEFDSRVSQMTAREAQIDSFQTDADKGSATLCIYHLAAGDGICDSTAAGTPKRSLLSIVNELTGLRVGVDPTPALNTLGEIETQQGENAVAVPSGVTRLYPAGLLKQKLDALRAYSSDVWKRVGGHY
jgi:hypothetical protein